MDNILLVDDDENILKGYRRNLRTKFNVSIANSGTKGLNLLQNDNYAVVISDYNMPGMRGDEFLSKAKEISPNTIRIMLTGFADLNISMKAVNEGYVFRFLLKPCTTEVLTNTIYDAIRQYELVVAEKELLNSTLKGSIKILIDILSVSNPKAFKLGSQFRKMGKSIANRLGTKNTWDIEIACLLSQIGCVGLPFEILEKKNDSKELSVNEKDLYNSHPRIGESLLKNIPRLEKIAEAISYQFNNYDGSGVYKDYKAGDNIPFTGRLLRILNDYFELSSKNMSKEEIINELKSNHKYYDQEILIALQAELKGINETYTLKQVKLLELKPGMILVEDIIDDNGFLLLPKGSEISRISVIKLNNHHKMTVIKEPIKVFCDD